MTSPRLSVEGFPRRQRIVRSEAIGVRDEKAGGMKGFVDMRPLYKRLEQFKRLPGCAPWHSGRIHNYFIDWNTQTPSVPRMCNVNRYTPRQYITVCFQSVLYTVSDPFGLYKHRHHIMLDIRVPDHDHLVGGRVGCIQSYHTCAREQTIEHMSEVSIMVSWCHLPRPAPLGAVACGPGQAKAAHYRSKCKALSRSARIPPPLFGLCPWPHCPGSPARAPPLR